MKTTYKKNLKSRWAFITISMLIVLSFIMMALPQPALAAKCKIKHTVEAGDTVQYLADIYQVDWREIVEANELTDPYVLVIGQILCIPDGTPPTDTEDTTATTVTVTDNKGKEATMEVDPHFDQIILKVTNFNKKTPYYVSVANSPDNPIYFRVGRMRTDEAGNSEGLFKMPLYFPNTRTITVCVKNNWTDARSCIVYQNPYYYYLRTQDSCGLPRRVLRR